MWPVFKLNDPVCCVWWFQDMCLWSNVEMLVMFIIHLHDIEIDLTQYISVCNYSGFKQELNLKLLKKENICGIISRN